MSISFFCSRRKAKIKTKIKQKKGRKDEESRRRRQRRRSCRKRRRREAGKSDRFPARLGFSFPGALPPAHHCIGGSDGSRPGCLTLPLDLPQPFLRAPSALHRCRVQQQQLFFFFFFPLPFFFFFHPPFYGVLSAAWCCLRWLWGTWCKPRPRPAQPPARP